MNFKIVLAYCTFPNETLAADISERLVTEGTVACANVFPPMRSIYRWNNQLQSESEVAVIFKTSLLKQEALKERIRAVHPYAVPSLVFLPVEGGNPDFLNWVYGQSL